MQSQIDRDCKEANLVQAAGGTSNSITLCVCTTSLGYSWTSPPAERLCL